MDGTRQPPTVPVSVPALLLKQAQHGDAVYGPAFYELARGLAESYLATDPLYQRRAIANLSDGLAGLDASESRAEWTTAFRYHLACAYHDADAVDLAARACLESLEIAKATKSPRTHEQIGELHARMMQRWPGDADVREVGEVLR